MDKEYKIGYNLPVDGPINTVNDLIVYKNRITGEYHQGWYRCGCCDRDGLRSTKHPALCTGCANKVTHGMNEQSPISLDEIKKYIDWTFIFLSKKA